MASVFGHIACVVGGQKLFPSDKIGNRVLLLGIVSSIIPDIDVISERFGIMAVGTYDFLGHRGLTHSIIFAIAWALILLFVFHKKSNQKEKRLLGIFYFLCAISHGVLDSMTNGGDGISFFFPFVNDRYFFPYRFIEVSPLGISSFFSSWGLEVLINELKYIGLPSLLIYGIGYLLNQSVYK